MSCDSKTLTNFSSAALALRLASRTPISLRLSRMAEAPSTEALKAAYGNGPRDSFAKVLAHVHSGRIESLGDWLSQMQR